MAVAHIRLLWGARRGPPAPRCHWRPLAPRVERRARRARPFSEYPMTVWAVCGAPAPRAQTSAQTSADPRLCLRRFRIPTPRENPPTPQELHSTTLNGPARPPPRFPFRENPKRSQLTHATCCDQNPPVHTSPSPNVLASHSEQTKLQIRVAADQIPRPRPP